MNLLGKLNTADLNFTMTKETFLTNLFDPADVGPSFTDPPPLLINVNLDEDLNCANCSNATSECLNCGLDNHNNNNDNGSGVDQDIYFLMVMICISFLVLVLVVLSMHRIIDLCFKQMVKSVRHSTSQRSPHSAHQGVATTTRTTRSTTRPSEIVIGRRETTGRPNSRHPSLEILSGIFTMNRQNSSLANMFNNTNSLPRPSQSSRASTLGRGDHPPPYDDPPPYHVAISVGKDDPSTSPSNHISAPNLSRPVSNPKEDMDSEKVNTSPSRTSTLTFPESNRCIEGPFSQSSACGTCGGIATILRNEDDNLIIRYSCHEHYFLLGQAEYQCLNGTWNNGKEIAAPICALDLTEHEPITVLLSEGTNGQKAVDFVNGSEHKGYQCAKTMGNFPWIVLDMDRNDLTILQIWFSLADDEPLVSNIEIRFGNESIHWNNPLCDWLDQTRLNEKSNGMVVVDSCQGQGRYLSFASVNSKIPIVLCDVQILVNSHATSNKYFCGNGNVQNVFTKFGECYHENQKDRMNQIEGQEYCSSLGLQLLTNENPWYYDWIKDNLKAKLGTNRQMIWLGAQRRDNVSDWFWNSETYNTLQFYDWGIQEPSADLCVVIDSALGWKWNAVKCRISGTVVCQKPINKCTNPGLSLNEIPLSSSKPSYDVNEVWLFKNGSNMMVQRTCQDSGDWSPTEIALAENSVQFKTTTAETMTEEKVTDVEMILKQDEKSQGTIGGNVEENGAGTSTLSPTCTTFCTLMLMFFMRNIRQDGGHVDYQHKQVV